MGGFLFDEALRLGHAQHGVDVFGLGGLLACCLGQTREPGLGQAHAGVQRGALEQGRGPGAFGDLRRIGHALEFSAVFQFALLAVHLGRQLHGIGWQGRYKLGHGLHQRCTHGRFGGRERRRVRGRFVGVEQRFLHQLDGFDVDAAHGFVQLQRL
ncbi:hypothetical protein D3C72_1913170 [compost metagenome]